MKRAAKTDEVTGPVDVTMLHRSGTLATFIDNAAALPKVPPHRMIAEAKAKKEREDEEARRAARKAKRV